MLHDLTRQIDPQWTQQCTQQCIQQCIQQWNHEWFVERRLPRRPVRPSSPTSRRVRGWFPGENSQTRRLSRRAQSLREVSLRSQPGGPSDNGWERSAAAWIADQGERGDFGRREVLDPVMLPWALRGAPGRVLDVGCGEGRFCRLLEAHGIRATGIDPTANLLARARAVDPQGTYVRGRAEALPFDDSTFDLVVSYLSLIDIPFLEPAIDEMARVLRPGGRLLIANLTSFTTARHDGSAWRRALGRFLGAPVTRYLEEHSRWIDYRGIRVLNHHRPLATYMRRLLAAGLELVDFDEPPPREGAPALRAARFRRAPWFVVMEWRKRR